MRGRKLMNDYLFVPGATAGLAGGTLESNELCSNPPLAEGAVTGAGAGVGDPTGVAPRLDNSSSNDALPEAWRL